MCGIAGFLTEPGNQDLAAIARAMADTLTHRGPDDHGEWVDATAGIALGHRRLSILDLSPAGHQPMISPSGRYVLILNGEIYNHLELREDLDQIPWRGHSDTETLLAAIDTRGLEATLKKCTGMFAFALWDRNERRLTLVRDRLGEKPLYYGRLGNSFAFASELKALRAHPRFNATIDREALTLFLRHNYIPAPRSIYEGIRKLPPGTLLTVTSPESLDQPRPYWTAREAASAGLAQPFPGDETEAVDKLQALLRQSVAAQMVADVPLGAFLSGGYDSSLVVALMQAQSSNPVKTFTIGFKEQDYDEARHAAAVARHLGTEHTELHVTPQEAQAVIPQLPELYDEPFADSSQIPTFLVARLARSHVTVSLSGDGGDELFGGYNRYFRTIDLWRRINRVPTPLRRTLAAALTSLSPAAWNRLFTRLRPLLPPPLRHANAPGDKLHNLARAMVPRHPETIYLAGLSHWMEPSSLVIDGQEPATAITNPASRLDCRDMEQRMMYLDLITYLPDDILVKVDRAAMGVSLETRVPLLDHRVVEFAWRLPLEMKMRRDQGKWILRQVLYRHVPPGLVDRPKMGFGIPVGLWLRGPLRDWAEALLDETRLRREGLLNPAPIRQRWHEHLTGQHDWQYPLWDVLMFQAWQEHQAPPS